MKSNDEECRGGHLLASSRLSIFSCREETRLDSLKKQVFQVNKLSRVLVPPSTYSFNCLEVQETSIIH
jgi:hypothetical protein